MRIHLRRSVWLVFLLTFLFEEYSFGQESYHRVKSALILKLIDHVQWPDESIQKKLVLGFYGKDSVTFDIISKISKVKGQNSRLVLRWIDSVDKLSNINALYVDASMSADISVIAKIIERKEILLISESATDHKYIMLNIDQDTKNNSVTFQINKTNIILENLSIDPKLLLLGGSEVDVRELYRNMKTSLGKVRNEVAVKNSEIARFQDQLEKQKNETRVRQEENIALKELGESQLRAIVQNEAKLKEYYRDLSYQLDRIKEQSDKLKVREEKLSSQKQLIIDQSKLIQENESKLFALTTETTEKQSIINDQNITLGNQVQYISTQKTWLLYAVGMLLLVIALSISIFLAYSNKKRLSAKLEETNKKLNLSNRVLYEQKTTLDVAYEDLEKAKEKLVESEKMAALGVLMAGVAHEINNPINFIKGGVTVLNLMQESNAFSPLKKDAEKVTKVLDGIDTGANRIVKIVKSLRSFSRTGTDEKAEYDLHKIIESALVILNHEYKNRIEVILDYQNETQLFMCDESKMIQVFTNLVSNSIQAIPDKGEIKIVTKEEQGKILVSVRDNGVGIGEEDMKAIMNPFFTTKEPGIGTGLGLSISYNIVTEHGGDIRFESKEKVGTTAHVTLPV